jgi:hypothetical protein
MFYQEIRSYSVIFKQLLIKSLDKSENDLSTSTGLVKILFNNIYYVSDVQGKHPCKS